MGKTIIGSVGQGGINGSKDVMTVQYLLNCVPSSKGGPTTELDVDGVVGPKTIAAIKAFQKANTPFCDGRVDAGKATFLALQKFDPSPASPLMSASGKGPVGESKAGPGAKGAPGGAKGAPGAGAGAKGGGAVDGKSAGAGAGAGAKGAGGGAAAPGAGGYGAKGGSSNAAQLGSGAKGG